MDLGDRAHMTDDGGRFVRLRVIGGALVLVCAMATAAFAGGGCIPGVTFWHDDWLEPRRGPPPHLHHGLDLFADFGTPIRAPDDGVISGIGDAASDPLGGNHVYMRGSDGTEYYFAHVMAFAQGLST